MMARISALKDNSSRKKSPRSPASMISLLPTRCSTLTPVKLITRSLLSMFLTQATPRKLWMSIAQKSSWEDNKLMSYIMFAKTPSWLLPWFSIWSFWQNFSKEFHIKLRKWAISRDLIMFYPLSDTCARHLSLMKTPLLSTPSSDKRLQSIIYSRSAPASCPTITCCLNSDAPPSTSDIFQSQIYLSTHKILLLINN